MEHKIFFPKKVWELAIHISISCYTYAFGISILNSCTENISATLGWDNSYIYTSIFTTLFPAGAVVGAIFGTPLSRKCGRKRVLIIFNFINILGCLVCIIPTNYTFGLGRLVTGVCGGVFITIPAVFINEITPDAMTGQVGTLVQQSGNLAYISAYIFGLCLPITNLQDNALNYIWMVGIMIPALTSCYQIFYFTKINSFESPKWLYQQGRFEEAKKSLSFVYTPQGIEIGLHRLQNTALIDEDITEKLIVKPGPTYKEIFFSSRFRKMLRISLLLNIGQQASGSMVIRIYSTSMFETMGGNRFMARVLTVLMGFTTLLSGLLTLPLIKKYGRKPLLMIGQVLICIDLFSLGALNGFFQVNVIYRAVLVYCYFGFISIALGSTFWAYIGEVCNDKCIGIGVATNLLMIVILSFMFPIVQNFVNISYCFYFFSGLALVLLVYESIEVFETKGLTKQEIEDMVLGKS